MAIPEMTSPSPTDIVPSGSGLRSLARSRSRRVCKQASLNPRRCPGSWSGPLRSGGSAYQATLRPIVAAFVLVGTATGPGPGGITVARGLGVGGERLRHLGRLTGHGFGHGIGMGQVGAYGYAIHFGWTWEQILGHYYGGTTLAHADPNQAMTVRLSALDDDPSRR